MGEIVKEALNEAMNASFSTVDGLLLRDKAWSKDSLEAWKAHLGVDLSGIEAVINHLHLHRLFWEAEESDLEVTEVLDVGRELKAKWEETIRNNHPHLDAIVRFDEEIPKDGWLGDLQVTAYVRRGA